jgi:cell division protein FtsB
MATAADIAKATGKRLLFLGVDTINWSIGQFQDAAKFARAHGIDSLLVKCGEGTWTWYGGLSGWENIKHAIQSEGVGAIAYFYSKGNTLGGLAGEIELYKAYMQADGILCIDMEVEWNSDVASANTLAAALRPVPGMLLISTWADPSEQAWGDVIRALAPATDVFMPQQYNDYLAGFWGEFANDGASFLIPTVILDQSFGVNHPVTIAQSAASQKHPAISIWYYDLAIANPALVDQVVATFQETTSTPPQEEQTVIILQNVANYFQESPAGQWQCKANGKHIQGEILRFYTSFGGNALCGVTYLGLPITDEINPNVSGHPECRVQGYERGVVAYDPQHALDGAPGAGSVYLLHIESSPQYTTIAGKLIALQNAYNSVVSEKNGLIAQYNQNTATITQLNQQIEDLKKQLANDNEATIQQLQQQVTTLTTQNTQLTTQIAGFTDKLSQIETLAKVS